MLEDALTYAELGYPVFPCAPNAKRPLTANGLNDATTDPARIEAWWSDTPRANVAIATSGLLVVDLDTLDGRPNAWLQDDPDKLLSLASAPVSLTPRGGRHFIFRAPAGKSFRNTASKLAPGVDTRADGGYILAPPSMVEGRLYRFAEECALDMEPAKLPEPPAWLMEALERPANERGNLAGLRLDHSLPANAIPAGQRNSALTSLAGTMRRAGMSEAEILAALHKANADRCNPPLDDHDVQVIAWSVARYEPDPIAVAVAEDHAAQDGLTTTEERKSVGPFPKHLLRVPGFIGRAIDFNLAGARKPQPILALGGALCLLSVLTGRKITDPYGTRTNLYVLGIGESGCGKERARVVNKEVLHDAGVAERYAEGLASHTGLVNAVEKCRETLFQVDEIGRYLKTLSHPNSAPHLSQVISVLMMLFTSAETVYVTDSYADTSLKKTIYNPHAVLYGTTVPKSLYEGFTADSVTDGFMSRMLVFVSDDPDPESRPSVRSMRAPADLVDVAQYWRDFKPPEWGDMSDHFRACPLVVEYDQAAIDRMEALERLSRHERRTLKTEAKALWTRATEKARKLALLYACSANHRTPLVTAEAAEWGAAVIEYVTRQMIETAQDWITETPFHARRMRVLRTIKAQPGGISQGELWRATRYLQNRERTEVLESLLAAGDIRQESLETGGRPRTVYLAT